jgi:NAD dependent epimerase/dehydratase family enzyme
LHASALRRLGVRCSHPRRSRFGHFGGGLGDLVVISSDLVTISDDLGHLGGHLGDGRQYMPWVHIDDVVGAALFALDTPTLRGPINVTAPNPLRASAFARALGSAMHRPAWLPVPTFALRIAVGEAADVVTTGQNAPPDALLAAGYVFARPDLDDALREALRGPAGSP